MNIKFFIDKLPKIVVSLFFTLNVVAMFFYPGGNINNPHQIGYSFSYNFFSDLGTTISYSGQDNFVSCLIFNFSLILVGLCFSLLFYNMRNIFIKDFILSKIASYCGVLAGICYIGVAFTPSNLFLDEFNNPMIHIFFAHWAFRLVFITSILFSVLIFKTDDFKNKYGYNFIIFGLVVLSYVFYSEFYLDDPRTSPQDLYKHVLAQKFIVIWMMLSVLIYSIGLSKYLQKKIDES